MSVWYEVSEIKYDSFLYSIAYELEYVSNTINLLLLMSAGLKDNSEIHMQTLNIIEEIINLLFGLIMTNLLHIKMHE